MVHPRIVCLAGAGSQSGRAWEIFDGIIRYLIVAGGFDRADFIEASYRVSHTGEPLPYDAAHSTLPLTEATGAVARSLEWIRREAGTKLHLLGWSLGGVVLFDAAAELVRSDPSWARDLGSIVTLASPLLGADVDGIDLVGSLAVGPVGGDLARRAADEAQKEQVRARARFLRESGIRIVTIAAEDDAVVTPEDALLPDAGGNPSAFILRPRRRPGLTSLESALGHWDLPRDPICWQRVLAAIGPAERLP